MATDAFKSLMAGWAGGVGLISVGHPFDTIKTRMQADTTKMYKGPADCLRQLIAKEGATAVYKGAAAPLAGSVIFSFYFLAYDSFSKLLGDGGGGEKVPLSLGKQLVAGAATGFVGSFILGPCELLKIHQQTAILKGVDGSMGAVVRSIHKDKGMRGFSTGIGITMLRDVPGSTAWFAVYELTKQAVCLDPFKPTVTQALFAGGAAGIGMASVGMPMDTIKTRIQSNRERQPLSVSQAAKAIFRGDGWKGFYKGFVPVLLRAFPANAACFAAKEMTRSGLDTIL